MVVLGVDVTKEELLIVTKEDLLKIAEKANVEAESTPAANVIRIPDNASQFAGFAMMSNVMGYDLSWGQNGQLLVRRRK